mmetsp:Transcript_99348/g.195149  ORF Transcript_99348/g.195149 Transcript_99348/m.195149 type:complete len:237 (+) Transcript_99348:72-782(+)
MESSKTARVKVQIGVSRQKANTSSSSSAVPPENQNGTSEKGQENAAFSSDTALINFCNSSFLRTKRKHNPESTKILTIDSDYKLKKTASAVELPQLSGPSEDAMPTGPRVEIINGQIVLKESSLMVANQEAQMVEGEYEEIEEGIHASSRYSSFLNKKKSKAWGIEETRQFYKALQQCGTEFSVMESFFPERTRKELKMKFFREENQHPELIKRALEASVPLDLEVFEGASNPTTE